MLMDASLAPVRAWRASRLPLVRFVPLALFLSWAASSPNDASWSEAAIGAVLAFALVAQFRLWDDIVDRHRDRAAHPERVMAQATSARAFALLCVALGAGNLLGLVAIKGLVPAGAYLLLAAGLCAWYRCDRPRDWVHTHVLTLKYPAFVLLLALPQVPMHALALSALVVYSAMCAFELLDNAADRGVDYAALGMHCAALSAVPAITHHGFMAQPASMLVGVMLALGGWRRYVGKPPHYTAYLPFVAAAIALHSISGGST